jgi:hypothetical protein
MREKPDAGFDNHALRRDVTLFVCIVCIWVVFPFVVAPGQQSFVEFAFRAAHGNSRSRTVE